MRGLDLRLLLVASSLSVACSPAAAPPAVRPTTVATADEARPAPTGPMPSPPAATPPVGPLVAGSLEERLRKSEKLAPIVDQASTLRFQVLLGVPVPDGSGWLEREGFRVDAEYFYPASAIKLCTAVAALEELGELRESRDARLDVSAMLVSEGMIRRRGGGATIASLVGGALVLSDNDANNDLFDLVGFDGVHERMWRLGLSSVRARHRLGAVPREDARRTPRMQLAWAGETLVVPPREGRLVLEKNDQNGVLVGQSHLAQGRVVEAPMSFEEKNRVSLADLQELLVGVMRPDLRPAGGPRLGARERAALVEALTALPSSRGTKPEVDREHKPLLDGVARVVPRGSVTLASKSGRAYGFVVENAYVVDARTGRSFFLAAAVYTNANGRLNDDSYEYDSVASPLLADLGEVVARAVFDAPPM